MTNLVISCPATSRSGYGAHARDLVGSFIEHDKFDVKIMDVPWGACPRNALDENNGEELWSYQMEAAGIVGPFEGSKARQVLIPDLVALDQHLNNEKL